MSDHHLYFSKHCLENLVIINKYYYFRWITIYSSQNNVSINILYTLIFIEILTIIFLRIFPLAITFARGGFNDSETIELRCYEQIGFTGRKY